MAQSQFQTAMMLGSAADRLFYDAFQGVPLSPHTFVHTVEKTFGWDCIGKGCYGAVFDHPKQYDLVFKIGTDLDDGWLSYAAFCMRNWTPGSILLQVHEIAIFERCYVAIFERLESWRSIPNFPKCKIDAQEGYALGFTEHPDEGTTAIIDKMHAELGKPHDLHYGNIMVRNGTEIVWTDPYAHVYGSESYKKYTRDRRVERTRTSLAAQSESITVRAEKEDRMLRVEPEHDNRAQPDRVQSALLPGRGPWWLRFAQRDADDAGVAAEAARQTGDAGRGNKRNQRSFAQRLLRDRRDLQAHIDMAREVRHQRGGGQKVQDRVQPAPEPHNPPHILGVVTGRMACKAAWYERAEVYHAGPVDFVHVDYAAIEQRAMLHRIQMPAPLVVDRDGGCTVGDPGRQAYKVSRDTRHKHERARDFLAFYGAGPVHRGVA